MVDRSFAEIHQHSIENPSEFWLEQSKALAWYQVPTAGVSAKTSPFYAWFEDGMINACHNAVDRHVESGRADQLAIIHDSPVTQSQTKITFAELKHMVASTAGALQQMGVKMGDRVVIYMPMIPEALVAMLACARIGAVHSVVFGGFAANELAVRIDDATPAAILTASCGIEGSRVIEYKPLLDKAIDIATHKPSGVMLLQRPQCNASMVDGRDYDWTETVSQAPLADCVPVPSTHPLYILYTSGTTGRPKGVVRDTGGYCVALNWSMKNIYGVEPGDVFWSASDVGWVVGHSYITYGPLIHGNTTVVYEGKPVGTPDAGAFWRVIEEHKVKVLFTAPTAFRAIRKEDPTAEYLRKYNLEHFEALYLAGERCDPDTLIWAQETLQVPVIDHWWQTETG
ncbi:MAG: AMP-binding protein, partial [Gammaproteobacteria bacterium]|nr:AMP-binding protein [Gammaproteobacteria bacterium]